MSEEINVKQKKGKMFTVKSLILEEQCWCNSGIVTVGAAASGTMLTSQIGLHIIVNVGQEHDT